MRVGIPTETKNNRVPLTGVAEPYISVAMGAQAGAGRLITDADFKRRAQLSHRRPRCLYCSGQMAVPRPEHRRILFTFLHWRVAQSLVDSGTASIASRRALPIARTPMIAGQGSRPNHFLMRTGPRCADGRGPASATSW